MPIITLLSDWGLVDHYVSSVKGVILSNCPNATIVDISHNIKPFDIKHAVFVFKNSWTNFPKGTIHIIGINSIESKDNQHIMVLSEGHYFLCSDNGIISLVLNKKPEKIYQIDSWHSSNYFTFPEKDRFALIAAELANGKNPDDFGNEISDYNKLSLFEPTFANGRLKCHVMHIDNYKNVFFNVRREDILKYFGEKPIVIEFANIKINEIVEAYDDVSEGAICCLFASNGFLQISINRGKASTLLGFEVDNIIYIRENI